MGVDRDANRAYLAVMSETLPHAAPRRISWPLLTVGVGFGALVAIACALWIYYGTAVFFEIVRAGIAACF
jgi:ABC-type amino acid transport system permease subunit